MISTRRRNVRITPNVVLHRVNTMENEVGVVLEVLRSPFTLFGAVVVLRGGEIEHVMPRLVRVEGWLFALSEGLVGLAAFPHEDIRDNLVTGSSVALVQ